jgi:hypothetical protein
VEIYTLFCVFDNKNVNLAKNDFVFLILFKKSPANDGLDCLAKQGESLTKVSHWVFKKYIDN